MHSKRILRPEITRRRKKSFEGNVRLASIRVLRRLLLHLSAFAFDTGVSVSEVHSILREAAVLSAVSLQLADAGRVNISGIAATTGLHRGNIANLNSARAPQIKCDHRTDKQSTEFGFPTRDRAASGRSAELKIYGRGRPRFFASYGRGIPTGRLDELIRPAIDVRPHENSCTLSMSIMPGITQRSVETLGQRSRSILRIAEQYEE